MSSMTHSSNWDTAQMPRLVKDSCVGSYVAPHVKAREAMAVASDVEAFLAAGGQIQMVKPPASIREALDSQEVRFRQRTAVDRDRRAKGHVAQVKKDRKPR